MTVAEVVGRTLVRGGIDTAFGVVGSGNFVVTNAMVAAGAHFVAARHECLGRVRGTGLLLGLEVLERDGSPSKRRNKRIVNTLASESRILIGYEGPHASILKLRPPMPFRQEHADLLVHAIDAAATEVDHERA